MNERFFTENLLVWHKRSNKRVLPWKGEKDPYKIWLSEILLQQTRADQVIAYYRAFLENFPDVCSLANASETRVLKLWEGLGYYSRCRSMMHTARYVCTALHGIFPSDYQTIITLKGVGPYTAAAILSFAYRLPYAVSDGNVMRVLARFFGIETPVDTTVGKQKIQQLAGKLLYKPRPDIYNQAIMDFGATVCKPSNPECPACPLNKKCIAYNNGMVNILPIKSKRLKIKVRYFNYLIIHYRDNYYLRQRKRKDIWQGLYEYPLLESDHLLSAEELTAQAELRTYFEDNTLRIEKTSPRESQQLTHQKIIAQFITISAGRKLRHFLSAEPVQHNKLRQYPFPKIITAHLADENK